MTCRMTTSARYGGYPLSLSMLCKNDGEHGPLADLTCYLDCPTVCLYDCATDCQPHPSSGPDLPSAPTVESLKDQPLLHRIDSHPAVRNADRHVVFLSCGHHGYGLSRRRVLRRILQEIAHHLFQ